MHVAVDCLIFGFDDNELKILLFKRRVRPAVGKWSLIGSFVQLDEDVDDAAGRVLAEITGLKDVFLEQLGCYGQANRDPGFRCISLAYFSLIRITEYDRELVQRHGASWHSVSKIPELVFDHGQMVEDALKKIRIEARHRPIGFELLREKFTVPQLQSLYEEIYARPLDPRNFRKKILSFGILNKLDEKDMTTSRRGAFLYEFNRRKYVQLSQTGFDFEIK